VKATAASSPANTAAEVGHDNDPVCRTAKAFQLRLVSESTLAVWEAMLMTSLVLSVAQQIMTRLNGATS